MCRENRFAGQPCLFDGCERHTKREPRPSSSSQSGHPKGFIADGGDKTMMEGTCPPLLQRPPMTNVSACPSLSPAPRAHCPEHDPRPFMLSCQKKHAAHHSTCIKRYFRSLTMVSSLCKNIPSRTDDSFHQGWAQSDMEVELSQDQAGDRFYIPTSERRLNSLFCRRRQQRYEPR